MKKNRVRTARTAEAARARRLARTAKAARSTRTDFIGRTARTTVAAAIGAGVLLHGGHALDGLDTPTVSVVRDVALVAAADPDGADGSGDTSGGDDAGAVQSQESSSDDSSKADTSEPADRETSTSREEQPDSGTTSRADEPGDAEEKTERPARETTAARSTEPPVTQGGARGAGSGSSGTDAPDAPGEPREAGQTSRSAPARTAVDGDTERGGSAPARATDGETARGARPMTAATPSAVDTLTQATARATVRRVATASTPTTRVTEAVSQNALTRLALALVGAPTRSGSGGPSPLTPSAPSSALLVAQWALFRRGENSLFNRTPVAGASTQSPSTSTGQVTGDLHVTDPDGDRLTYTVLPADQAAHGSVSVASDGTWTYRPDPTWAATGGTDTFVVTVRDNVPTAPGLGRYTNGVRQALAVRSPALADRLFGAHTVRVPVTVTVAPTNKAPVVPAAVPTPSSIDESSGAVAGALGVTDPDGDALTYTGPATRTAKGGVVGVDRATGAYVYQPSADARHAAAARTATDADRTDSFTILVTDGRGEPVPMTVTVPISPTNAPPGVPATLPAPSSVDTATGRVTGTTGVTDGDGDRLVFTVPTGTTSKGGTVTVDRTSGVYTYTPGETARHAAAAGRPDDGVDSFTMLVDDGHGALVPVTVTVPISPFNAPPRTSGTQPAPTSLDSGTGTVTGSLGITDSDGDVLTYTGPTGPTGKGGTVTVDRSTGVYTYTPDPALRHAAATGSQYAATDTFTVLVDDGHGAQVPVAVTVAISPSNTAPSLPATLPAPTSVSTVSGQVTGGLGATDADGDVLVYDLPTGASGTSTRGGRVGVDALSGRYTYTPTAALRHRAAAETATDAEKVDTFTVNVRDQHGAVIPVVVTVPVTPTNVRPTRTSNSTSPADEASGVVTGSTGAQDADQDTLTYTGPTGPTAKGGTVVVDGATGRYTYTPSAAARHAAARLGAPATDKQDSFTVVVSDGHGGEVSVLHTVAVSPANAAPVAGTPTVGATDAATGAVAGDLGVTDADRDALTWSTTSRPTRGTVTVDAASGTYTYTPTGSARLAAVSSGGPVTDTFTLTASDGYGGSVPVTVTVTVTPNTPATNTVLDTVSVGQYESPRAAAYLPDGSRAYVATYRSLSVIDTSTGTVVSTIPVASAPRDVQISADGSRAYVISQDGTVTTIDTATDTVIRTVKLAGSANEMLLSPDGGRLHVVVYDFATRTDRVVTLDTGTGAVQWSSTLGSLAWAMTSSPDGQRLSVLSITDDGWTMSTLDPGTGAVVARTVLGGGSYGDLVISPDGSRAYASESNLGRIEIIDTATGGRVGRVDIPTSNGSHKDLALSADGTRLYVTDSNTSRVSVIDTRTRSIVATVPLGTPVNFTVGFLELSPRGDRAYVNNYADGTVTVIDTATNTVVATVPVGTRPGAVAVSPDGTRILVPNTNSGSVSIVYTGPGGSNLV